MSSETNRRAFGVRAVDLVDVFVYLAVLGLFVQLFPAVITESFAVSLITAVLLKLTLEAVVAIKTAIVGRIRSATSTRVRIVSGVLLIITAAGSKFLVLWLTDVVLGDAVHLGGFLQVTALIVTLMVARAGVRRLIRPRAEL